LFKFFNKIYIFVSIKLTNIQKNDRMKNPNFVLQIHITMVKQLRHYDLLM